MRPIRSIADIEDLARRRLPASAFLALRAGSERGVTYRENQAGFAAIGLSPPALGQVPKPDLATTVFGQPVSMPLVISPTGVQAVHPEGEVAVARVAAAAGVAMGLSSFASRAMEDVAAVHPGVLFQLCWTGTRSSMRDTLDRAAHAGVAGLILTLDWSFAEGRDWGSPALPERIDLRTALRFAPEVLRRPRWLLRYAVHGRHPDLTVPNLARAGGRVPTFFEAYRAWRATPPPTWDDISWLRSQWDGTFMIKGIGRADDARRAIDAGANAISVSNHGGNNLDGSAATIRLLPGIVETVGRDAEVVLDGGVRWGSDVVKCVALGARAAMIGRPYLWGLAAAGPAGVEAVLEFFRAGIAQTMTRLRASSLGELGVESLVVPAGFRRG